MEMGLHGPERPIALVGDLGQRELAEEAQDEDLAIGLLEAGDRGPDRRGSFRANGELGGIRHASERGRERRLPDPLAAAGPGRVVGHGRRVDPGHGAPPAGAPDRDPRCDPGEPGAERAVAAPGPEGAIGGHEGLLRSVLGLVKVAQDPVAGADDAARLPLDEGPERIGVARQDGGDDTPCLRVVGRGGSVQVEIARGVDREASGVTATRGAGYRR